MIATDATSDAAAGQVSGSAAEVYENFFGPAILQQWAPILCAAAEIGDGDRVLDVACGTGIATREAARRAGPAGHITGLDRNPGMLAVARSLAPQIDWHEGRAEKLPFARASFDAVLCQFGLMFFEDRAAALAEMWRVLVPGGTLAVAVWASADASPGYAAMIALLDKLFGAEHAAALAAPFALGDRDALAALFASAGLPEVQITQADGTAHFPSIESWVHTEIKGWTLAEMLDDDAYARLQSAAAVELQRFAAADGSVAFPLPALIATVASA